MFHAGRIHHDSFVYACSCGTPYWCKDVCRARLYQYGAPTDKVCKETAPSVFTREWSKATVTVDCDKFTSEIKMKGPV